jgi:hypothetical protein
LDIKPVAREDLEALTHGVIAQPADIVEHDDCWKNDILAC